MRCKSKNRNKALQRQEEVRTFFAWYPITINGETRWMETVTVRGYWFIGMLTNEVRFNELEFVDQALSEA